MMREFAYTITCSRPAETAGTDEFGNTVGEARPEVTFEAAFVPPGTALGSHIVDGVLRQITVTKPTLYVDRRAENADALTPGAIRSTDPLIVDGVAGYEVDGDPSDYTHPWTGWRPPLVIELRKSTG